MNFANSIQLLLATSNPGKVQEISAVLGNSNLTLLTPASLNIQTEVEETGSTYEENARLKASYYHNLTGQNTLGEDSGIIVDALSSELGVHTRRWGAGASASDQEWLDYFMQVMTKFPDPKDRKAKFISHMCLIFNNQEHHFYGETTGTITSQIEAPLYPGLPLSSVFKPDGFNQVYTALGEDQKNQISHRGKAIKQVANFILNSF